MKLKSFDKYLAARLSKAEINAIEKRAKLEKKVLERLQQDIAPEKVISYLISRQPDKEIIE